MSSVKRSAGRELNHDNWNEEEEAEDAGEFKRANEDELKKRSIKVAKRRNQGDSTDGAKLNPFSGFGGFNMSNSFATSTPAVSAAATASPFAFLAKIPATNSAPQFGFAASTTSPKANGNLEKKDDTSTTFHSALKEMNFEFSTWIKKNLDENAIVDLTPCFKSYEEQFKKLKASKESEKASTMTFGSISADKTPAITKPSEAVKSPLASFSFGAPAKKSDEKENEVKSTGISFVRSPEKKDSGFGSQIPTSTTSTFSFGLPAAKPSTSTSSGFSFGGLPSTSSSPDANKTITSTASSFSFGFSKPEALTSQPSAAAAPAFSFGLPATSTQAVFGGLSSSTSSFSFGNVTQIQKPAEEAAEEDEAPPKNEFVPVVEDDSLFSKRCKVYVKGSSDYADRGVGTLYIKKVEDKVQLLVRADTNLGNILLNIMLVNGLPVSRMGKNNVMIVCVPTPDSKPPPTSVLLRVKNSDEADDLLAEINKNKMSE